MPFLSMMDTRNTSCDSLTSNGLDVIVVSEGHTFLWLLAVLIHDNFLGHIMDRVSLCMFVCGSGWKTALPIQPETLLEKINVDNIDHSCQGLKWIYIPFFQWQLNCEIELLRLHVCSLPAGIQLTYHNTNCVHHIIYIDFCPLCRVSLSTEWT